MEIELKSGRSYYYEVENERGGPQNKMSEADIVAKFHANLGDAGDAQGRRLLEGHIRDLHQDDNAISMSLCAT